MKKIISGIVMFLLILCVFVSCSDKDTIIINPGEDVSPDDVKEVLNDASKEWGKSREALIKGMNGYTLVTGTEDDMLQFQLSENSQSISYQLKNGQLCGTAILFPVSSLGDNILAMLEGYKYVGELTGAKIYENIEANTMAAVWEPVESNSSYCAIGFAPIKSDAYEKVKPITVTITKDAEPEAISCTFHGNVSGVDKEVEVGFIYSSKSTPSESYGKKVKTTSKGNFSLTQKGVLDDQAYYYRAYALVDDIYYLSEVKEFTTEPLTYVLNGITYRFVKVEGGDMPPFSIMQTEYPCVGKNSSINIAGFEDISIDGGRFGNKDGTVIITEFRSFWINIKKALGLPIRLPHRAEWVYAAQGGAKSHGYDYSGSNEIDNVAWYSGNSEGSSHPVAEKQPNELGLYDMSGNYAELCFNKDTCNIDGPYCGGSWKNAAADCKVTSWKEGTMSGTVSGTRISEKNAFDCSFIGLRLVYSRNDE